ncbi:MAG: DNA mismatch endonuclease Vsr [Fibrobacteria bacterium]|nr:DNA mismatch endonuclease Vsr [Fibrobacteria bacterium]
MDSLSGPDRSALMSRIRGRDTKPEIAVRSILHRMGYRFRLHGRDLPGSPDIVLPGRGTVVFVHGCFWHRHKRCKGATTPKTNVGFWTAKFEANVARDVSNRRDLRKLGWRVMTVWECQLARPILLERKFASHLGATRNSSP